MFDRSDKNFKPIEVGTGLLVGTILGGLLTMAYTGKTWTETFENDKLLMGIVGIAVSLFLYARQKRKSTESQEE